MLVNTTNPNPLHIVRGMKVPCSSTDPQKEREEWAFSSEQVKPISEAGSLPDVVQIRRDGLLTLTDHHAITEWILPPLLLRDLENGGSDGASASSMHPKPFEGTDIQFYGIPKSDKALLFSAPITIQWDLTSRCNLRCKHCYADATSEVGTELSIDEILRIVDEAARIGVKALHLLGGEPFARVELVDIVRHACQQGISCHISSNGTLIKPRHAEVLEGLDSVTVDISIDSVHAEHHDWLRGKAGAFAGAMQGIHLLQEHGIAVGTTCTIYPTTLDEMDLVAEQACNLDLYRLQFLFVSPVGRAERYKDDLLLDEAQREVFSDRFRSLVNRYRGKLLIDSPVVPPQPGNGNGANWYSNDFWLTGCLAGIDKIAIRSDGSVTICPQLERSYGNLKDVGLEKVWADTHSQRLASLGSGCSVCGFEGYCGGGCPAPSALEDEIAPCPERRQPVTFFCEAKQTELSAYCPTDSFPPCSCPLYNPCDCPTWCNLPCNFPCSCPTWCSSPCSCPTWCNAPCPFPCDCPSWCSLPCPFPCSCPTHCPFPR